MAQSSAMQIVSNCVMLFVAFAAACNPDKQHAVMSSADSIEVVRVIAQRALASAQRQSRDAQQLSVLTDPRATNSRSPQKLLMRAAATADGILVTNAHVPG